MKNVKNAVNDQCNAKFVPKEIRYCPGAIKELGKLPLDDQISFLHNLNLVAHGLAPTIEFEHLGNIGPGVIELKINGSPAYRCVYYNKLPGVLWVVLAATKTSEGQDLTIIRKGRLRLKALK
ncbi:type II toxin-antitoxin system RelE/ParE family toxin [Pseudomonas sp. NPDC087626]|uniref:type II toxin-antitoxin system RelE/ParE family toxin n=1 Tax=Pseudomonas sp. NPDC087626 TaxID=3364444 RepID=UPI003820034F